MKHLARAFTFLALLAVFLATPLLAQEAPSPWKAGDDVYAFDVGFTNTAALGKDVDVTGTWLHYAADNHRTGVTLLYLNNDAGAGYGLGPSYEFLLPKLKYGRLGIGGDASMLGQDLDEAGAIAASTRLFYEFYVGTTAAVRFQARYLEAIGGGDPAVEDQVNQYGLNIGILLGKTQAAAIQ